MIALAVLATSFAIKAANVDWGVDMNATVSDPWDFWDGKSYYAINGDASTYITMLTDGDIAGFEAAMSDLGANVQADAFGIYSFGGANGMFQNAADTVSFIALNSTLTPDATFYYNSVSTAGLTYEAGSKSPGTAMMSTQFSSATIGAIPEPTSGLLLLLGVAGLALRRRRA